MLRVFFAYITRVLLVCCAYSSRILIVRILRENCAYSSRILRVFYAFVVRILRVYYAYCAYSSCILCVSSRILCIFFAFVVRFFAYVTCKLRVLVVCNQSHEIQMTKTFSPCWMKLYLQIRNQHGGDDVRCTPPILYFTSVNFLRMLCVLYGNYSRMLSL